MINPQLLSCLTLILHEWQQTSQAVGDVSNSSSKHRFIFLSVSPCVLLISVTCCALQDSHEEWASPSPMVVHCLFFFFFWFAFPQLYTVTAMMQISYTSPQFPPCTINNLAVAYISGFLFFLWQSEGFLKGFLSLRWLNLMDKLAWKIAMLSWDFFKRLL